MLSKIKKFFIKPTTIKLPTNRGVILGQRNTDYVAGTLPFVENNPSGDWTSYLPPGEWQRIESFDTMACVSFSALNVLETLYFFQTKQRRNFSDRFTAFMSGTTPNGNYLWKVADSIRKDGLIDEESWPAPSSQPSWNEYYTTPPIEVINKAKKFLEEWQINYEFIDFTKESLIHHLKQSPIQVVIPGHAIMNFFTNNEVYKYFDSYAPFIKERTEPFVSALKYVLSKKNNMEKLKIIGSKTSGAQYVQGIDGTLHHITNTVMLEDLHTAGVLDKNIVEWVDNVNEGFSIGNPWAPIRSF